MGIDDRIVRSGGRDVAAFLATATVAWKSALGRNLTGVYVHGSLATGAFNPRTSDIDVMVTTGVPTDAAANDRLRELHLAMLGWGDERWADRLELTFVPSKALVTVEVPELPVLQLHPDQGLTLARLGPDFPIQKHLVRTWGITLLGRDPARIIPPVSPGELREAQLSSLRTTWAPQLEFPGRFLARDYQASAVLTMCRAICLLTTGEVVTKPHAAAWALQAAHLEPWWPLIRSAVDYPGGVQLDQRAAGVDFVRFTLEDAGIGR